MEVAILVQRILCGYCRKRTPKKIAEYIRTQLHEDNIADQISLKEYIDPFTGEQVNKGRK